MVRTYPSRIINATRLMNNISAGTNHIPVDHLINHHVSSNQVPQSSRSKRKQKATPRPRFAAPMDTLISPNLQPESSTSGETSAFMAQFILPGPFDDDSSGGSLTPPPELDEPPSTNIPHFSSTSVSKPNSIRQSPRKHKTRLFETIPIPEFWCCRLS